MIRLAKRNAIKQYLAKLTAAYGDTVQYYVKAEKYGCSPFFPSFFPVSVVSFLPPLAVALISSHRNLKAERIRQKEQASVFIHIPESSAYIHPIMHVDFRIVNAYRKDQLLGGKQECHLGFYLAQRNFLELFSS